MNPIAPTTAGVLNAPLSPRSGSPATSEAAQSVPLRESRPELAPTPPGTDPAADHAAMAEMVDQMQKAIAGTAAAPHTVAFRQDEETNDFVIEIRDPKGDLIKQFPPEKVLNLRRKLDELTGMVIDQMT